MTGAGRAAEGLTRQLLQRSLAMRWDDLPPDARRVARDCLIDWLGCTLAGVAEPAAEAVADLAAEEGGHPQARFIGREGRGSLLQAALVNGTASHALDYDDVNLNVPGHLSVAILPAAVAVAEHLGADIRRLLEAFTGGYEFACRVGRLVEPAHYANGFHATATIGCLGAAVACARLLGLEERATLHAIGVAATQAAGMKAMFGTMAKPLHAGLAAQGGLRAALLARRGFTARPDSLECEQGFAALHGQDFRIDEALASPPDGPYILANLFKFHAACYSTHATIEAVAALRRAPGMGAGDLAGLHIVAGEGCTICNLPSPTTALEAKFSLRAAAAFAWLGLDTASLQAWGRVNEAQVVAVRDKVTVALVPGMGLSDAVVRVRRMDGRVLERAHDCGVPLADKARQSVRVEAKFRALATEAAGAACADAILKELSADPAGTPVSAVLAACGSARRVA